MINFPKQYSYLSEMDKRLHSLYLALNGDVALDDFMNLNLKLFCLLVFFVMVKTFNVYQE